MGGVVGVGIFSTLSLVITHAGQGAAVGFVLGGLVAMATGHSLARLTLKRGRSGRHLQLPARSGPDAGGAPVRLGGLDPLVKGANFVFLAVFALVNLLAIRGDVGTRWISITGLAGSVVAALVLLIHLLGVV